MQTMRHTYVTEALSKAIHEKIIFRNTISKKKTTEFLKKYKKHKNFCSRLYKKERKKIF